MGVVFAHEMVGLNKDKSHKRWAIEIRSYICPVNNVDTVCMAISHGKLGGKMQEDLEFFTEGKQGRTPCEQAIKEAHARIKKQYDKNYRDTCAELLDIPILAMLAKDASHDLEKRIPEKVVKKGVFTSDKFDGLRLLAKCEALGVVKLYSRTNQLVSVPHIEDELRKVMNPGDILDGEIYKHGYALQEIQAAVNNTDPEEKLKKALNAQVRAAKMENDPKVDEEKWYKAQVKADADHSDAVRTMELRPQLEFHVFDLVILDIPFQTRLAMLEDYADTRFAQTLFIKLVQYRQAFSYEGIYSQHADAVERGYEGLMIRLLDGMYESGKRSGGIWKLKVFVDDEFLIVGVIEDKFDGSIFQLKNNQKNIFGEYEYFYCVMGTMEERKEYLLNQEDYIEKFLTVQFQTRYKKSNLPQFPTGKAFREGRIIDGKFFPDM